MFFINICKYINIYIYNIIFICSRRYRMIARIPSCPIITPWFPRPPIFYSCLSHSIPTYQLFLITIPCISHQSSHTSPVFVPQFQYNCFFPILSHSFPTASMCSPIFFHSFPTVFRVVSHMASPHRHGSGFPGFPTPPPAAARRLPGPGPPVQPARRLPAKWDMVGRFRDSWWLMWGKFS